MTTIAVIGAGVIGLSWARLARDHDWDVVIYDTRDDLADVVAAELGNDPGVRIAVDMADAVADADLVQECGPERLSLKQQLFEQICAHSRPDAVLATSSSSITASLIAAELADADAGSVLVGHPFNPPELMPLVEVVPGDRTDPRTTEHAVGLYRALDRVPVVVGKEMPGFVANRLQYAVSREALYLVQQGVVGPEDLDRILQNSLGLRWATIGLYEGNVLGGGPGGYRHLMEGIVAGESEIELGTPSSDRQVTEEVIGAVEKAYGTGPDAYARLRDKRDRRTRLVLADLRADDRAHENP